MAKSKKSWVLSPSSTNVKTKLTEVEKNKIEEYFQPLINKFKEEYIEENPNKEFNYLIDIYSKWYHNYFYLCQKYKSEHPNRTMDEFEEKFVRLKYKGVDQFDFSYFRYTQQWYLVATNLTLKQCEEIILSNPNFHPIG